LNKASGLKGHSNNSNTVRTISVILPCYNEETAVSPVLDRLRNLCEEWRDRDVQLLEVLIVDDGSTDGTRQAVDQWNASFNQKDHFTLKILTHEARQGYGAAIKTGIASAQGGYVAFYDVDGTYDPIVLPNMIEALERENAEMVCGDRLSKCEHMPYTREFGNRLFVGTINILYRTRVYDSCTGMRLFTRNMSDFFSSRALPNGLDYSLAMTLAFLRTGHRLVEIPIPYAKRIGRSKLSVLADGPRFFIRILSSWIHTPLHLREVADARKQLLQSSVVTKKK
jgi:glycosyltransferase involved in cell wall biosynthesis